MIKSEVVDRIKLAFKDGGLSAYKASLDTSLVDEGINKILTGVTKNPRKVTIDILVDWLFTKGYSKKWLESGEGEMKLNINESESIFDHDIELFNRLGKSITDDEFAAYLIQNKARLFNNTIIKMMISEMVKDGIIEYYENDRKNNK